MSFLELFKLEKDKKLQCCLLHLKNKRRKRVKGGSYSEVLKFVFSEREASFSLEIRMI